MTAYLFWSGLLIAVWLGTRRWPTRLERSDRRFARRHRCDLRRLDEEVKYLRAVDFYYHNGFSQPYDWDQ